MDGLKEALPYSERLWLQDPDIYQRDYCDAILKALHSLNPAYQPTNQWDVNELLLFFDASLQKEREGWSADWDSVREIIKQPQNRPSMKQLVQALNRLYRLNKTQLKQNLRREIWPQVVEQHQNRIGLILSCYDNDHPYLKSTVLIDAIAQNRRDMFKHLLIMGVVPDFEVLLKAINNEYSYYIDELLDDRRYPQCIYDNSRFYNELMTQRFYHPKCYDYRKRHANFFNQIVFPASPKSVLYAAWLGMLFGGLSALVFCLAMLFAVPVGGVILSGMAKLSLAIIKGMTINLDGIYKVISDLAQTGYGDVLIPFVFIVLVVLVLMPYVIPPLLLTGLGMLAGGLSLGIAAYILDRSFIAIKEGVGSIKRLFEGVNEKPMESIMTEAPLDESKTPHSVVLTI